MNTSLNRNSTLNMFDFELQYYCMTFLNQTQTCHEIGMENKKKIYNLQRFPRRR